MKNQTNKQKKTQKQNKRANSKQENKVKTNHHTITNIKTSHVLNHTRGLNYLDLKSVCILFLFLSFILLILRRKYRHTMWAWSPWNPRVAIG